MRTFEHPFVTRVKCAKNPPGSPILKARDIHQPSQGYIQRRILHPELSKVSLV